MKEKAKEVLNKLSLFKHRINGKVRFAEVDSFGVVHNVRYLFWLEAARTEYFSNLGIKLTPTTFIREMPFMVVHAEIDYLNAARFNDEYNIYSRVASVKNSSLTFENIITLQNDLPLAYASATLVHLNIKDNNAQRIGEDIRLLLNKYEGENIKFLD